jgi:hypothetical protein
LDGGLNWITLNFDLGFSIKPKILMVAPGSSNPIFILIGSLRDIDKKVSGRDHHAMISIDFSDVLDKPVSLSIRCLA